MQFVLQLNNQQSARPQFSSMASADDKVTAERKTGKITVIRTTSTTKPSAGNAAPAKLGAVLERLVEFTKARRNANVVLEDGVSEAHALLREFLSSQKASSGLANAERARKPSSIRKVSCQPNPAPEEAAW